MSDGPGEAPASMKVRPYGKITIKNKKKVVERK